VKDDFYRELSNLLRLAKSSDIIILAGDMNAQVGQLSQFETHLGVIYGVRANRTDNGNRLLQTCADHNLYLASTNFVHKKRHCVTWRSPGLPENWTQIDHIAISHRWRGSVENCRSYWGTYVETGHAPFRARISLRFTGKRTTQASGNNNFHLHNNDQTTTFRTELARQLQHEHMETENDWSNIRDALKSDAAVAAACSDTQNTTRRPWISARSTSIMESRCRIPADRQYDRERQQIRRQLTLSLRNDREQWWITKAKEMERAGLANNNRLLFRLIKQTGTKRIGVSETITERDGSSTHKTSASSVG